MNVESLMEDKYIKLAISLKAHQLKREELSSLTYHHVESAIVSKWKYEKVFSMHQAINDIMSIRAGEVVAYLSNEAIMAGSKMKLNDFEDLFGGERE